MDSGKVWGWELILDASGCDLEKITNYHNIYNFIKQLVTDIDMKAWGEPEIVFFGSDDKAGYTLTQLIETSNICVHFVNSSQALFLNVHSCKKYDPNVVIDLVTKYFGNKKLRWNFLERIIP